MPHSFVRDDFLGGSESRCAEMTPGAYGFQEYFLGGDYYSAATWRGPAFISKSGDHRIVANNATPCCENSKHVKTLTRHGRPVPAYNVSRNGTNRVCTPPQCDETEVFFESGTFPLDVYSPAAAICGIAECRPGLDYCPRLCAP